MNNQQPQHEKPRPSFYGYASGQKPRSNNPHRSLASKLPRAERTKHNKRGGIGGMWVETIAP